MVIKTLEAMRQGGIFDHLGFGFHRYSVDERWLVPHFEKMLYDQAMLAMAYLEAYQALGKEEFRRNRPGDLYLRPAGHDLSGRGLSTRRRMPTARAGKGSSTFGPRRK